ncbi:TolC family protein [Alkalilimnicola ehrlichii]|uniref:TolC family protein n=1 Tax=Alkalilimnicola ehrlichii TaxID=351052 RepID=UPI003B9F7767
MKKSWLAAVTVVIMGLVPGAVWGGGPSTTGPELDLRAAISKALELHPNIRTGEAHIDRAQARLDQADAQFVPHLSVSSRVERLTLNAARPDSAREVIELPGTDLVLETEDPETDMSGFTRYGAALHAEYMLYDFGRRQHGRQAAASRLGMEQARLDDATSDTVFNVTRAYFDVLRFQNALRIQEDFLQRRRENLDLARRLHRAGRVTEGDVVKAEAERSRARLEVTRARHDLEASRVRLRTAMGLDSGGFDFTVAEGAELIPPQRLGTREAQHRAIEAHPRLEAERRLLRAHHADLERLQADRRPEVRLTGNYRIDKFHSGPGSEPNYVVGLQMEWRFFDGGQRRARAAEARAEMVAAAERQREARRDVLTELHNAQRELTESEERIELSQTLIRAAEQDLRSATIGYREGIRTFSDLSDAALELREAELELALAEFDRQQAVIGIYWAMGRASLERLTEAGL